MDSSNKITIVADSAIPFLREVLEPFAKMRYIAGVDISPADVADADALIVRTRTRCNERLLGGSAVRLIATATIGSDHIDTEYCRSNGIKVRTAAGCNARGVLQWESAVLAALSQERSFMPHHTTIGVVGAGHTGSLTAQYAARWGFRVIVCDPPRERAEAGEFVSLETIATESDIVTFHVPLTTDGDNTTMHMADRQFFDRLKTGAIVINSSRGEVVDTAALRDAVERRACNCVIDTWENELDIDRLVLRRALIATPHIAGYSEQGKATATAMSVNAVAEFFGLPLKGWYPADAERRPVPYDISWKEMCATIAGHYDIFADSAALKASPERFEQLRNNYNYRKEYF